MRNPYLIQRLLKPYDNKFENPFSFGGGLQNGGLSKEAMQMLKDIWRYDYMGSAEFEWGAIPKSLEHIAKNSNQYRSGSVSVKGCAHDYQLGKKLRKDGIVYFVCKEDDSVEVVSWIHKFADNQKRVMTKEHVGLAETICQTKYSGDKAGWHDIDNHYLFFTDKKMFDGFKTIFGIQ